MSKLTDAKIHYDMMIDENNDSARDSEVIKKYMNKWDGEIFDTELALDKTKSVLEIGVGTGRIAIRIVGKCGKFTGIDLSEKSILRAWENLTEFAECGENTTLTVGDFLNYQFYETFDVIYSSLTFMHIREKATALKKISALLNSGGRFVLSIDKNQSEFIDMCTRKIKVYPDSPQNIKNLAEENKLEVIDINETEFAYIITIVKK